MTKSYKSLQAEMARLQKQIDEAKSRERDAAVKKVRELCREFDITQSMLKGYLSAGRRGRKPGSKNKNK